MARKIKISPSILAADFSVLGEEIKRVEKEGVDFFHIDVMDGVFVPNISVGIPVVEAVKKITDVPLDVHLMILEPERFIDRFVEIMKGGVLSFHIEASRHPHRALMRIKEGGVMCGLALNPGTPLSSVEELLEILDFLVIMTVNPGFYGQKFIREMLPKIKRAREMIDGRGLKVYLEVDGGVDGDNIDEIIKSGADVLVAGAYIFKKGKPEEAIREIRKRAENGK